MLIASLKRRAIMKNFISVKDVSNINSLVGKALDYKNNPFKTKTWVPASELDCYS